jgi:hypothetical protein
VTRYRWSVLAAVVLGFAAGCSKTADAEAARSRAEVESLRAELARLQAQHNELRAEVELLRTASPTPLAGQPRPKAKGDVAARFEAASALTSPSERQRVYTAVVLDAATIGDADTVKKCLENITSPSSRQEATYRSALRLAAAGKATEGITLAKALTSPSQRERALSKIAQGDHQE